MQTIPCRKTNTLFQIIVPVSRWTSRILVTNFLINDVTIKKSWRKFLDYLVDFFYWVISFHAVERTTACDFFILLFSFNGTYLIPNYLIKIKVMCCSSTYDFSLLFLLLYYFFNNIFYSNYYCCYPNLWWYAVKCFTNVIDLFRSNTSLINFLRCGKPQIVHVAPWLYKRQVQDY